MTRTNNSSGHPATGAEQPRSHHADSGQRPSQRRLRRVLSVTGAVVLTVVTLAGMLFAGALVSSHDLHQGVPSGAGYGIANTSGSVEAASAATARQTGRPGRPRRPVVVAFVAGTTGTIASDLLAPYDIFASSPAFHPYVVAAHADPVPLEGGPALVPTHTFTEVDANPALQPDLVVVPALSKPTDSTEAPLRNWVSAQHQHGAKVLGVCAGALVLAQTGMLDGLDATSHWSRIGVLEKSRPAVHWLRGRRWVEDGSVTTTAAVSSGVPAALHLVAELAGSAEAQRVADLHPELGWSPRESTAISKDHFALSDVPVGLDFVEPWFRPTVGVALTDGVGELDATAAFEVYTQSAAGRAVPVADGNTVRTEHGLTLLTTSTGNAPSLSWLVVPGTQNIDPAMRRWAESRDLDVEPLRAVGASDGSQGGHGIAGGGGFAAALENLADHVGGTTERSTAKMIGYPTRVVDLDGGHTALRTGLLAAGSLAVAVLVGMTPGAIMRHRRAAVAGGATAGGARRPGQPKKLVMALFSRQSPPSVSSMQSVDSSASAPAPTPAASTAATPAASSAESPTTTSAPAQPSGPSTPRTRPSRPLGWIVAVSLATGVLAAKFLAFVPFVPVTEAAVTGAVLCGFAIGWATLLGLSQRFTDQPQRWAAVPAAFMATGGLLLVVFGSTREVLSWIWPPVLLGLVVWMVVRVHRDLRGRAGRIQLYAVFSILALCAVGGAWQVVSSAGEPNPYLAAGRLVTVDGHQLRLECTGSGSPTVVLEPGAGGTSASMGRIAPVVAARTRTCVYDRGGRGGSEPAAAAQDGAQIATDLHTLLHSAGVPGPYVLAGHSFGGPYVRIFAAHYPDEVAGLVLLDSTASSEPAKSVIPAAHNSSDDASGRFATLTSLAAPVGLARLYGELAGGSMPARYEDQLAYDIAQGHTVRSVVDEYMRGGATVREAASLRDFGDKPLFVLTAGEHPESWMTDQQQSASLSTNSVWRVVDGATHQGLLAEKQYAVLTSQAVLDVVTAVRTNQPLTASENTTS